MNARQKAKKYKRMYEQLLKPPVKVEVEQYKIDTVRFERFYPEAFVAMTNGNHLREVIVNHIAHCLAEGLDEYIDYRAEFCHHLNKYRLYGEIKVVRRK